MTVSDRTLLNVAHDRLEALYRVHNRREFVDPDPLQHLFTYGSKADQEIVALVASSLAFGGVKQIIRSVQIALDAMPEPARWIRETTGRDLKRAFHAFKHRFVDGNDVARLLLGVRVALDEYGSLRALFLSALREEETDVLPAMEAFVQTLLTNGGGRPNFLLPSPAAGSACKRLNLYLRWMARHDDVDPGTWAPFPIEKLIIPLDTHMHRIARAWNFTRRPTADLRTAREVTQAFRRISPDDPVRYDFTLTRLGMKKLPLPDLFNEP